MDARNAEGFMETLTGNSEVSMQAFTGNCVYIEALTGHGKVSMETLMGNGKLFV